MEVLQKHLRTYSISDWFVLATVCIVTAVLFFCISRSTNATSAGSSNSSEIAFLQYKEFLEEIEIEPSLEIRIDNDENQDLRTGLVLSFSIRVRGVDECIRAYSEVISEFASVVTFAALDPYEYREARSLGFGNPSLQQGQFSEPRWTAACEEVVEVREAFVGCTLDREIRFPIAFYLPGHFDSEFVAYPDETSEIGFPHSDGSLSILANRNAGCDE